ncbi:arginine/ornithine antiporter [Weissella oryzae SG25]|uniref:Arginine/ornithine antiporter n=1 Tax=Weissella oryzae (strain DSM 25784 / JCM 18191 / LMG 30913 / SG25) TaxID=1329250 RepID=A0A069CSU8_WEIOS|nr:basic amino acid/polyamine antiporter [Weissella oryzae]GAK30283.1 arginine/ornithine antiporter [Weissella oryzae SG25]
MEDVKNKGNTAVKGLGLAALITMAISSSIGAGIFDLPATVARAATPGAALLAWLITGFGILMLALSMSYLAMQRPNLSGFSDYAREGFGDFAGFLTGWGYWLSAWLGNVAFATIMMSAFGYFFPAVASGNSVAAIFFASLISWGLTLLVINGVESAALINLVVLIAKLIPIFAFIVIGLMLFKAGVFTQEFWYNFSVNTSGDAVFSPATAGGILNQVRGSIMVMMWVFVGVEGASMMASRARRKKDVGRATVIGILSLIAIYLVVSMIPYGYLPQSELVNMDSPALVYIFGRMVGGFGGAFISIGLILSILGAWLSWTMLPVEATSQMTKQGLMPKWFGKTNKKGAPINSLLLTQVLVQCFMISLYFSDQAYDFAFSLSTAMVMICYGMVAAYLCKVGFEERHPWMIIIGGLAVLFQVGALLLAGLGYLWICSISYILGFAFYIYSRRENNKRISKTEWIVMAVLTIIAIGAIWGLATGVVGY